MESSAGVRELTRLEVGVELTLASSVRKHKNRRVGQGAKAVTRSHMRKAGDPGPRGSLPPLNNGCEMCEGPGRETKGL